MTQQLDWQFIWQVCLLVAIGLFAFMAVATTIGGAADVRRLLRSLSDRQKNDKDEDVM